MKSISFSWKLVPLFLVACATEGDGAIYDDAVQLSAIAELEGVYTDTSGNVSVRICQSDAVVANTCVSTFWIRRAGEDINSSSNGAIGCGGCPYSEVQTGVRMQVQLADGAPFIAEGEAVLGQEARNSLEPATLELPFQMSNVVELGEGARRFDLSIAEDHSVVLQVEGNRTTLTRTGDADCIAHPIEAP